MFNSVIIILLTVDIILELRKIKALKRDDELYEELKEKITEVQVKVHSYVEVQKGDSISIEELAEKVSEKLKKSIERAI